MKGKFIVLYGINNIGKSTQAALLVDFLKKSGKKVKFVKFPVYDLKPSGDYLNKILRSGKKQHMSEEELQLWYVLNRYQYESILNKFLAQGITVVAEDYTGTGIAWGVTKGAKLKDLEEMNKYLRKEDLAILIDGDRGLTSREHGHLHESQDELVEKCRQTFLKLQKKYGWKLVKRAPEKEETARRIQAIVKRELF